MGGIVIDLYLDQNFVFVCRAVLKACGVVHVAGVCGTLFQSYYDGAHWWFYNGSCSDNAPLSTVASGVLFCDWWTYGVGINGRRTSGIIWLACNTDMTGSIEVCGERSH